MNIGITCIGYNCKDLFEQSLKPWFQIVNNPSLVGIDNLTIGVVSAAFHEIFQLGFNCKSTDGTEEFLKRAYDEELIDYLNIDEQPRLEYEMWSENFNVFKENPRFYGEIDYLWMLNSDEIWNIEEIKKTIEFIKKNPSDIYKVHFKNYFGNYNSYFNGFNVNRIWDAKRLSYFFQDDLTVNVNGIKETSHNGLQIDGIRPCHYSWIGEKQYLQRKLDFQKIRYAGLCSYQWNSEKDCIELNPEYYKITNQPLPILQHD